MFSLTNKHAIAFYESHPNIDFNSVNKLFVEIMEKLFDNVSCQVDNNINHSLIQELSQKINSIQEQFSSQNDILKDISTKIHLNISELISSQQTSLTQILRDTIKSNNGDSEKNILQHISLNNEHFLSKISSITNNEEIRSFFSTEVSILSDLIRLETSKLTQLHDENDNLSIISKLNEIVTSKFNELDTSFKIRFDSLLSSQSNSNNSMYSQILSKLDTTTGAVETVSTYFQKQSGSNSKGKQGESKLEIILSELYPSASIVNTSGSTASGDFIIERTDKNKILIDTKDYETCIPIKEVDKILRDIEINNCNGILISQHSGIAQKNDFEINVHNNNIIVFIHNAQYDPIKIQIATNIIDHLEPILIKNTEITGETIPSDTLLAINNEFRELASQKLNILTVLKKNYTETIKLIERLDLPTLTNFLETKYANTGKTGFKCDLCNDFIGKNSKSLSAHQRKCKKDNIIVDMSNTI
jgi:hypothetical protein